MEVICRVCKRRTATVFLGGFMAARGLGEELLCDQCWEARVRAQLDQALEELKSFKTLTGEPMITKPESYVQCAKHGYLFHEESACPVCAVVGRE